MEFHTLVGNPALRRVLSGRGKLPHALLFAGEEGSGRHTAAREVAQAMVCSHPEQAPCGHCSNCRKAAQGIHPDLIQGAQFTRPGDQEFRVDAARALRQDAQIRPNEAPCKVYFLDQPLNPPAQNALLKLIEDGPEYARFLIVAQDGDELLDTLRSRCVELRTTPVPQEEALAFLSRRRPDLPRQRLWEAVQTSGGNLGRALARLEEQEEHAGLVQPWFQALSNRDELAMAECVAAVQTGKWSRPQGDRLYQALQEAVHAALLAPYGGLASPDGLWQDWTQSQLLALWDLLAQARSMGERNVSAEQSAGWLAVSALAL